MAPRTTSAVILSTALLLGFTGVADATTGVAGSGSPAAVQYQPEDTGQTPVTPPADTPPAETPPAQTPPVEASAPSVSAPTTTTTPASTPVTTHAVPSKSPAKAPSKSGPGSEPQQGAVPVAAQAATPAPSAATLPFTGFDVVPVALAGLALLCVGLVLRRRTRDVRG
jgi:hypothetical protein